MSLILYVSNFFINAFYHKDVSIIKLINKKFSYHQYVEHSSESNPEKNYHCYCSTISKAGQRPLPPNSQVFFCHAIEHFLLSFFKCVQVLHFEMNHSGDGDVFLSYFPSRSDLNFITQQTLRFYFFRMPASLTLALTLSLVGVSSSSDCSHAAHIIIAHIFFRFLINSVHMSVKDHHP